MRMIEGERFKLAKLAEGKTKIIWETTIPEVVLIESKDDITAGDGQRHHLIPGKGILANEATVNCFRLLKNEGIPTHFITGLGERTFWAQKARMIPLESVARRIATGSYLKRHPGIKEGHKFRDLKLEFFYKDDANHDPLVEYDTKKGIWKMYDAKLPKSKGLLETKPYDFLDNVFLSAFQMKYFTKEVFGILEKAFRRQGVVLKDLKIEFGFNRVGQLLVADVIDADSWRTNPPLDKQRYRDLKDPVLEDLELIKADYQKAAILTKNFLI